MSRQHSSSCAQPSCCTIITTCDRLRPAQGWHSPLPSFLYVLNSPFFPTYPRFLLIGKRKRERIAFSAPEALRFSVHFTGQSRPSTASRYVFRDCLPFSQSKQILYNSQRKKVKFHFGSLVTAYQIVIWCGIRQVSNDNVFRLLGLLVGVHIVQTSWRS